MAELGELLDYEQPTDYIVDSVDYSNEYKMPVLTAGKTFILGYTNEKQGIFKDKLPVIIFDDFTTAIKFVDFPFKVKSSAMKILIAKNDKVNIKYIFYVMQRINFQVRKHKRHWISEYSKIKIPLPHFDIQKKIVDEIENYQKQIEDNKKQIAINEKRIENRIAETWGDKSE
jgi:type I restriction enzyme S subunit